MSGLFRASASAWGPVLAVSIACYALTCSRTVNGGDSGELMNAAWSLGVAHPPGYPLFTLAAHLFARLLPFGEVGFRINLFSACCGAAAAAVLAALVFELTRDKFSAWFAGALLALSPLTWRYAVVTEVFALNQLLVSLFLLLFHRWLTQHDTAPTNAARTWRGLAFVAGLCASHHHTSILVAGPLLLFGLVRQRGRLLGATLAFGALGLLPYIYLPLAARAVPRIGWGDTSTWKGFLTHFLRSEYGTFSLGNQLIGDEQRILERLWHFAKILPEHTFFGVGIFSAFMSFRRPQDAVTLRFLSSAGAVFAFSTLFFCALANISLSSTLGLDVQSRFWLLPLVFFALAAGVGVRRLPGYRALVLVAVVVLAGWGFAKENQRQARRFEHYGVKTLETLPPNALLFFEGDHTYGALQYAQNILGLRPDVDLIHLAFLSRPWGRRWAGANVPRVRLPTTGTGEYGPDGYDLHGLVDANLGPDRDVFLLDALGSGDVSLKGRYALMRWGVAKRVVPQHGSREPLLPDWLAANARFFDEVPVDWSKETIIGNTPGQRWENIVVDQYATARFEFAIEALQAAQGATDPDLANRAELLGLEYLESMDLLFSNLQPLYWLNLGVAYRQRLPKDPSLASKWVRAWMRYVARAQPSDPRLPEVREALRRIQVSGQAR